MCLPIACSVCVSSSGILTKRFISADAHRTQSIQHTSFTPQQQQQNLSSSSHLKLTLSTWWIYGARAFFHLRFFLPRLPRFFCVDTSVCSGLMRASCALNKLFMITNSVRLELLPCSAIHRSAAIPTNVVFYPNDLMVLRMPRTPCDRWILVHSFLLPLSHFVFA